MTDEQPLGDYVREVMFTMSGRAFDAVSDGGWPQDNPRGWTALNAAASREVGKGTQHIVTMRADDASDLANYLWSLAGLWESMTATERDGDDPRPLRKAIANIEKAAQIGGEGQ